MTKENYHHGDLQTALLDAAEDMLNADPGRDISIRGLANALGVSATAPHAHFKTKADLLAALAKRGFDKLHSETTANIVWLTDPKQKLEALAASYLNFSVNNAGLYKIMFTTGVILEDHPELFAASRTSYAVLQDVIGDIFPQSDKDQQDRRALAAWSLVHGLSALLSEDRIPADIITDRSPQALAKIAAASVLDAKRY